MVGVGHHLARRDAVALEELREETFALDATGREAGYNAAIVDACRAAGFEPRVHAGVPHDLWEAPVVAGECVGITVATSPHASNRELHVLTLDDGFSFAVDVAWPLTAPFSAATDAVRRSLLA